jgi:hypothetical protein
MPVEVVVLTWGDVLLRGERVQLSVVGKGPLVRQSPAGDR